MQFPLYIRKLQMIKKAIAYSIMGGAYLIFTMLKGPRGGGESYFQKMGVPDWQQWLILIWIIIIALIGLVIASARATGWKLKLEGEQASLEKEVPRKSKALRGKITSIKPDFQSWMYNDDGGEVWIAELSEGKPIKILVEKQQLEEVNAWKEKYLKA